MRDEMARQGGNGAISLPALLTRARDQDGVDRIWSLSLASQVLRERRAPRGPLD